MIPETILDGDLPNPPEPTGKTAIEVPVTVEPPQPPAEKKAQASADKKALEKNYAAALKRIAKPDNPRFRDRWSLATLRATETVAKIYTKKLIAGTQLVDNLNVKERLVAAIEIGEGLVNDTNLNGEVRLKGVGILAAAAKVVSEIGDQNVRLAELAEEKSEKGNGSPRKNLPPMTGMEMTIGEGSEKVTARVVANNGAG